MCLFPQTLGRVAGRVRLHILYSTQRMDIDRRSPQFTAQREDIRVFFSKPPHAHCKLPGLSQSYYLSPPAAHPAIHQQVLDLWAPPGFLDGWAPGTR